MKHDKDKLGLPWKRMDEKDNIMIIDIPSKQGYGHNYAAFGGMGPMVDGDDEIIEFAIDAANTYHESRELIEELVKVNNGLARDLMPMSLDFKENHRQLNIRGRSVLVREKAHLLSWMIENGDIPAGMIIRHKCDNPSCCNPAHLFIGTHKTNRARIAIRNGGTLTDERFIRQS